MKLPSNGRALAGALVLALWGASAASLIVDQAARAAQAPLPHPEIPGDDPQAALGVLEGCGRLVSAGDSLGVVYAEGDTVQLFLAFRLAYELYPRDVFSISYAEGKAGEATALVLERHPTQLLVLGAPNVDIPGVTLIARLGPGAHLLRVNRGQP